jgi:hypothetical protein
MNNTQTLYENLLAYIQIYGRMDIFHLFLKMLILVAPQIIEVLQLQVQLVNCLIIF